jgi:guanine deaminase
MIFFKIHRELQWFPTCFSKRGSSKMKHAVRGSFVDFSADPFFVPEPECVRYFRDGLLVMEDGIILDYGAWDKLRLKYRDTEIVYYPDKLIMPGFIDAHVHYPQTRIIGSYGEQLLTWLDRYVYPEEKKFANEAYAREVAVFFLEELLRGGTTTALVLTTTHAVSVEVFFQEALQRNLRMVAGKMMMDRNAPEYLLETPAQSRRDCERLITQWHGRGRLLYALTPRFALSCTPELLTAVGELKRQYPGVYMHTHLSENDQEVKETLELFPGCSDYLEVYETYGMVTDRSVFAHGLHLSDPEFVRLSGAGAAIAHCPTSNLFLGSGLFKIDKAKAPGTPAKVGIGTDVGAGTSFSMLKTLGEAYKVAALQKRKLSPFQAFYLATLGGAKALSLDDKIGNFQPGKEADFVVLDFMANALLRFRGDNSPSSSSPDQLADRLFTAMILGNDRIVHAVYILGRRIEGLLAEEKGDLNASIKK